MKKALFAIGLAISTLVFGNSIWAQESAGSISLDEAFVQENHSESYREWTGGYAPEEINTFNQIMDIGGRLGRGIKYQENNADPNPFNKGNPAYKYSAARVYGSSKRGADVLLIGQTATVDTIKCLKMIIRGYLMEAFGYSYSEAISAAENICYWNTNRFNDRSYFERNFEADVLNVFADRCTKVGLSEDYAEWKQSIIIIPHTFSGTIYSSEYAEAPSVDMNEISPETADAESAEEFSENDSNQETETISEDDTGSYENTYASNTVSEVKKGIPVKTIIIIAAAVLLVLLIITGIVIASRR